MPRRNRNVDTVDRQRAPERSRVKWNARSCKPSVKRRRFRLYGGEL
jgi:hypothetical protein